MSLGTGRRGLEHFGRGGKGGNADEAKRLELTEKLRPRRRERGAQLVD
jgi:hypothetical protein